LANIPASRQRRLNPLRHPFWIQSSLTRRGGKIHAYRGLKPTAKFRRRYAAVKYAFERKKLGDGTGGIDRAFQFFTDYEEALRW